MEFRESLFSNECRWLATESQADSLQTTVHGSCPCFLSASLSLLGSADRVVEARKPVPSGYCKSWGRIQGAQKSCGELERLEIGSVWLPPSCHFSGCLTFRKSRKPVDIRAHQHCATNACASYSNHEPRVPAMPCKSPGRAPKYRFRPWPCSTSDTALPEEKFCGAYANQVAQPSRLALVSDKRGNHECLVCGLAAGLSKLATFWMARTGTQKETLSL